MVTTITLSQSPEQQELEHKLAELRGLEAKLGRHTELRSAHRQQKGTYAAIKDGWMTVSGT